MVTPKVELELSGRDAGWTDITADVLSELSIDYGIQGSGPADRTASTGVCRFQLNNSERNSVSRLGYYTIGGPNARPGFVLGIRIRVQFQDPATSTWYVKFIGSLVNAAVAAGRYGSRRVVVEAADWFDEAARSKVSGLTTQINKRSDEVMNTLIGNVARAPEATSIPTGKSTFEYALDTTRDDQANAILQEISRVTMSELGYCYQKGDGTVIFEPRFSRVNTSDAVSLTETEIYGLATSASRDDILTRVQVITHPRTVDAAPVVLYRLQSVVEIPIGADITLLGPYTDPNNRASRVGGVEMVTPVATTDYLANSQADGLGVNLTASLSWTFALGGNGARATITNNSGQVAYITKLQARGKGIYDFETTLSEAVNTALASEFGEANSLIDMPYQSDPGVGFDSAQYLLSIYEPNEVAPWALGTSGSSELGVTTQLAFINRNSAASVRVMPKNATIQTQILTRDVGDRVHISESMTGVDESYYIQSVTLQYSAPGILSATWGLAPADTTGYFELGISTLGETSRLAFA